MSGFSYGFVFDSFNSNPERSNKILKNSIQSFKRRKTVEIFVVNPDPNHRHKAKMFSL